MLKVVFMRKVKGKNVAGVGLIPMLFLLEKGVDSLL
jgi:hypothetical protein